MATYCTIPEVRDFCQITWQDLGLSDETKFEDLMDALVLFAEKIIDDYCNVPPLFFTAGGVALTDEYHDHDGSGVFHYNYYPVITVTNIEVRSTGLTQAAVWTAITAGPGAGSSYLLYPEMEHHGKVYIYANAPPEGYRNIRSDYTPGYAAVPTPIAHLTKELVANTIRGILKRKLTPQEISQVIMAGGDIRLFFAEDWRLSKAHRDILDEYQVSEVRGKRG